MSPDELRVLDRQLATGEAKLDLTALGGQSAPSMATPERTSTQQSRPAAASKTFAAPEVDDVAAGVSRTVDDAPRAGDDVSKGSNDDRQSRPRPPHSETARTLDSIIKDLSSVTADGGFTSSDTESDGQASVEDLLERLKRLVDISEKAIGDLAFGGASPEGEGEDGDDDTLPWFEEPGTCMDHEFYYGGGGPRKGTENVANLFADEALAKERFSRPLPYGPMPTSNTGAAAMGETGTSSADVASRADVAASRARKVGDADADERERVTSEVGGADGVRQEGALSSEAAALLRPKASVGAGSGASESGQDGSEGESFKEAGLLRGQSSGSVSVGEADKLDTDIESMAASLGLFQDAGPGSKVTIFEAPRAGSASQTRSEGNNAGDGTTDVATAGGWVGQKMVKTSSGDGVGLEEAVRAAVSVHTGPERTGKKGVSKGRGLSKAFSMLTSGSNDEGPGRGKKAKKRRGGQEKRGSKVEGDAETGLRKMEEGHSEEAGVGGRGLEGDPGIVGALFGDRKRGDGERRVANPILRQAVAAVGNRIESTAIVAEALQPDGSSDPEKSAPPFDTPGAASEGSPEASGDAFRPEAIPPPHASSSSSNSEALNNSPVVNQPTGDRSAATPSASDISDSPDTPENPSRSAENPFDSVNQVVDSGDAQEEEGTPSESKARTRKEEGYPDWMPKFFDNIHPESPTFDPELFANTHPIKRAILDNDSEGLFPDFSEQALRKPIPGLAKLSVPEPEPDFEPPASNSVSKELNVSAEQRKQVLDAANATTFDPAAYDKTAPPWEAFRGFGTSARELDGWDADIPVNLPDGEEEFEIPVKGGGTKRVRVPAGGFRNEEELIDAFGDLGTFPYMADTFDPVTDDEVLEEVPPPDIPPEDAAMLTKLTTLSYSMRDYLGMDQDPTANFFKKGLVNSFVTFEDPLHCFTSATLLEDWFDLFARNGYPPKLDFIWYECDPAHRWKRWVYTTLTVTLPNDLKHQLEAWGAHGWFEAEFGDGPEPPEPEPQPEGPEPEIMPEFRKVFKQAGLSPMKKKPKPLVLEMFSKFEMDESGKITSVFTKWDDFEEDHVRSTPRMQAKRWLFMAALLRKEWGR